MSVTNDRRLSGVSRGQRVQIVVDGLPVLAFEGESVAASLLAAGRRGLRVTARAGEQRGMYCGIGLCFDCVMTIDGQRAVRTCVTAVRDGMEVTTRHGHGLWAGSGRVESGRVEER
ncbi:(2Fe-2S)-binding protein [Frankia sp. CIT1]|uniref:(2Fe-2S)-binding protein n=1 Tax=Frankia sp. CIT1 TaxID=2880974 RepID=UPI00351D7172